MKVGKFIYVRENMESNSILVNIGDYFQCFVLENIVNNLIIDKSKLLTDTIDYIEIKSDMVKDFNGEYTILPIQWSVFLPDFIENDIISISPKIIPVFLAVNLGCAFNEKRHMNIQNISYLKKYEPIGCRDEYTKNMFEKYGLSCYLNGCLTATLPKRKIKDTQNELLFVDVPEDLRQYVPIEILSRAKFMSQQYYENQETDIDIIKDKIILRYKYYEEFAKAIVTSRLHVALPALAMGIPVIFTKTIIDSRFSFLEKLMPLYALEDFKNIDWNFHTLEFQDIKEILRDNVIDRINKTYEKYYLTAQITEFYENREKKEYTLFADVINNNYNKAITYLNNKYGKDDEFEYSIWGLSQGANNFYNYVTENYKNSKLLYAIDGYKEGTFGNTKIVKVQDIEINFLSNIFVIPVGACNEAHKLLKKDNVDINKYCLCAEIYMN